MKKFCLLAVAGLCFAFLGCENSFRKAESKSTFAAVVGKPRDTGRIVVHNKSATQIEVMLSNEEQGEAEVKILKIPPHTSKEQAITTSSLGKIQVDVFWHQNGLAMAKPLPLLFDYRGSIPIALLEFE